MKANNKNNDIVLIIDKDRLKAYVEISAPEKEEQACTLEDVEQALIARNIKAFILDNIKEAIRPENWGKQFLVAEGKAAQDGVDAEIEFKFPLSGEEARPRIDEKGNADYHELGLINNVKKGQLLVQKIPATSGIAGVNVYGEEIHPRPGKDKPLPRGKNTFADDDNLKLYAAIDGHVSLKENRVIVSPVFEVSGDVDFSSGDLNFLGDIRIRGSVNSGFKVIAAGDIEVGGFIEGAQVIADGDILVKGGITTGAKGIVKAGGTVAARFIENSFVEAGRDVLVREAIMQSQIKAGGSVRVTDKKATIVGGIIQASQEVESKVLGSQLATQTVVEVGVNPHLRNEYLALVRMQTEKKALAEKMSQNIQVYQRSGISPDSLSSNKKLALIKLLDDFKNLRSELTEIEKRIIELEEEFLKIHSARVKASEIVFPGVRICIGQAIYIVNDPIKYSAFILEEGEVKLTSLR